MGSIVAAIAWTIGFYIDVMAHFCLDFGNDGSCDAANRAFGEWLLFAVIPIGLLCGGLAGWGLLRLLRRREARRRAR